MWIHAATVNLTIEAARSRHKPVDIVMLNKATFIARLPGGGIITNGRLGRSGASGLAFLIDFEVQALVDLGALSAEEQECWRSDNAKRELEHARTRMSQDISSIEERSGCKLPAALRKKLIARTKPSDD